MLSSIDIRFETQKRKRRHFISAAALMVLAVAVISAPVGATATTVINRTVPDMTSVSGLVLSGVVISVEPNRTAPGYPLATRVTIAVDHVFKGFRSGPTISFMIPGGVRDGKVLRIPGMPSFRNGEHVVVFLERTPHGWIPSGLKNGKYVVSEDEFGQRTVWRDSRGLDRLVPGMSVTRSAQAESDVMTFDELVGLIEEGLDNDEEARLKDQSTDGGAR